MKKSSILMIVGASLLLSLFYFPLWNIELGAPQYPIPLGMNIYIDGIKGVGEFDLQNIDGLNHYIGMKTIPKPEQMWEFTVFPIVVASMAILGIALGIGGYFNKVKPSFFLGWLVLMAVLGIAGMYDFNLWLVDYGSDLDPHAIMKMVDAQGNPLTYEPPLFGHRKILNFDAYSYPHLGAYLMGFGLLLTFLAYVLGIKSKKK
ncbi:hypothetical protein [Myroides odoratus]|uniref:Uncharacterized protein n=1 Tax=Myroides odoratus TaxID=256 RepID=A0A9Q6ZAC6_MYROD|nr:hypothetical protein [Myroides odoratus]EHQ44116.1 hypothetical protein Myrod_3303 [Myroides odoratus DSM 2801]EKB05497.1 hypothetical protein HMPREF9716_02790 [Myroides odoratus CIP 103059]QQU01408.1 hypothetical protein I6I88_06590 [Myroides odoratus]WQD56325.1 hypothetical protein U0010_12425 [Myroides odoratus]STZ31411.1 Uncharacterised protein [Myroides odoratus]